MILINKMRFYLKKDHKNFHKSLCQKKEFNIKKTKSSHLDQHQIWLSNFVNPKTPYKSMFVYHGLGTGKTCTAITIAENFKENASYNHTNIFIVSNANIQQEFEKNFYNENNTFKCTGTVYEDELKKSGLEVNSENVMKLVNEFYKFTTYEKIQKVATSDSDFKEKFDNTIVIVDEAHTIRMKPDNNKKEELDAKKRSEYLMKIARKSTARIVLLSATPLYDNVSEIIYFLNLLELSNTDDKDNFNEYKATDFFEEVTKNNWKLKKETEQEFINATTGMFSYLQSGDPTSFPLKLYDMSESSKDLTNIQNDIQYNGEKNEKYEGVNMKITETIMTKEHENKIKKEIFDNKGNDSFDTISITLNNRMVDISQNMKNDVPENFAPKSTTIAKLVQESIGTSYIYTNFVDKGIIPQIYELEKLGYKKHDVNKPDGTNYFNKFKNTQTNGLKYVVITSRDNLKPKNVKKTIDIFNHDDNKDGSIIKTIIASRVGSEGIDLKNVRNVHILEADFNMSTIEQAVGRAIRKQSHKGLDRKYRNTTVYFHATKFPTLNRDTIDIKLYKLANMKQKNKNDVLKILKSNSVTCDFFKEKNAFAFEDYINAYGDVVTNSKGVDVDLTEDMIEIDNIKCLNSCDKNTEIDIETYEYDLHRKFAVFAIMKKIEKIFTLYDKPFTFDDIVEFVRQDFEEEKEDIIKYSLTQLIKHKVTFVNVYGLKGRILFDKFYYFIYINLNGTEQKFNEGQVIKRNRYIQLNSKLLPEVEKVSLSVEQIKKLFEVFYVVKDTKLITENKINKRSLFKSIILDNFKKKNTNFTISEEDIKKRFDNENDVVDMVRFINKLNNSTQTDLQDNINIKDLPSEYFAWNKEQLFRYKKMQNKKKNSKIKTSNSQISGNIITLFSNEFLKGEEKINANDVMDEQNIKLIKSNIGKTEDSRTLLFIAFLIFLREKTGQKLIVYPYENIM